jgi:hypothetical protein
VDIHTSVVLEEGDSFAYTADAAAMQVLTALGGNATNDRSTVTVQQMQTGTAGVEPVATAMETASA